MTQQNINVGTGPDSYTGESLRTAFQKVNDNFSQLYAGNVGANISGNIITANGFVTSGNLVTGNVTAAGNISAYYFTGDGSRLTGLTVSANTGNIAFSNLTISGTVAGNIVLDPAGDGNVNILSTMRTQAVRVGNIANSEFAIDISGNTASVGTSGRGNGNISLQLSANNSNRGFIRIRADDGHMGFGTVPDGYEYQFNGEVKANAYYADASSTVGYQFTTPGGDTGMTHDYQNDSNGNVSLVIIKHDSVAAAKFYDNNHTILSGNLVISQTGNVFGAAYPDAFIQAYANVNSYSQTIIQNLNSGNLASSDVVATANNGDDNGRYINMGIASSTYNVVGFGVVGPNDGYLYVAGNSYAGPFSNTSNLNIGSTTGSVRTWVGAGTLANVVTTVSPGSFTVNGNITSTANIQGAFILGNGSQLTGMSATYSNANVASYLPTYTGNIAGNIVKNGYAWTFGTDGTLTLPAGGANITATSDITIQPASGQNRSVVIRGGNQSLGTAGGVTIESGVGSGATSVSGNINITASGASTGRGGHVFIRSGSGYTTSGDVSIIAAAGTNSPSSTDGNVIVTTKTGSWTFGAGGNLALPNGAVIRDTANNAVAFGSGAGETTQGTYAVAVGTQAGSATQGAAAVAVGLQAGQDGQGGGAVAIGAGAGLIDQNGSAVAIGYAAGETTQGVYAVAIGASAGRTLQGNYSIILNATGANLNQTTANTFTVSPVRNDVSNVAQVVFYNTTSKEITYGNTISVAGNVTGNYILGNGSQLTGLGATYSNTTVAAFLPTYGGNVGNGSGYFFGNGSQLTGIAANYGNANVKIYLATVPDDNERKIQGYYANLDLGATARLYSYGASAASFLGHDGFFGNININYVRAGQGDITIATNNAAYTWVFNNAGNLTLPNGAVIKDTAGDAVAFGQSAGLINQGDATVAIGLLAGNTTQGIGAVAVGAYAGSTTQGVDAVAVGDSAGYNTQGNNAIAIGASAGTNTQGKSSVAIGQIAGRDAQGNNSVAVGFGAGYNTQGANAVAVGSNAGTTNQANNSIIINATGNALEQTRANTFTVAPVRNDVANIGEVVFYNTTSKEITYGNTISVAGNITAANFIGNISITGNVQGTSTNVTLVAGSYSTVFDNTGNTAFANGTVSLTTLSATGNVSAGNLNITGNIVDTGALSIITGSNGNITLIPNGTGIVTASGAFTAVGNITGGNIITTGNITGNTGGFAIGYRDIPQVVFTSNATLALTDAGKHYFSSNSANVITVPNNTTVSFNIGTAISIVQQGTANLTVTPGSGVTMYLAGNSTSSSRTLGNYGMATLMKVDTNTWFINGTGVN
jgi:hypothetical protein